jgi:hypothetical protein
MLDQHMQISLGPVQIDDEGWSRNWYGWGPDIPQVEIWEHNCEVWSINTAMLHKFWLRTNRVLTLVAMQTKQVVCVVQVNAILRVVDIDVDQVAHDYLDRVSFRGRVLVDHPLIGTPFVPPEIQHGPVHLVPGTVSLEPKLVLI